MKDVIMKQKEMMLKAIINSKDLVVFQHEEETLSMMYWKYANNTDITADEIKEDLLFLDNLAK